MHYSSFELLHTDYLDHLTQKVKADGPVQKELSV